MQILAHRTAMINAPPNSLEGLNFCWDRGVNVAECDLSFTSDEKPIIWNNEDEHLLKKPVRFINGYTFEEIKKLERKDSEESLLDISDLWRFLKTHPAFVVLFDVKYYDGDFWGVVSQISSFFIRLTVQEVIEPAIAMGLASQIGFVTFEGGSGLLKTAKKVSRNIRTNLIVIRPWAKITGHLGYLDGITVGWGWRGWNHWRLCPGQVERLVEEIKNSGREIWGGLAKNSFHVKWLEQYRFNGVWTDNLDMVKEVLR